MGKLLRFTGSTPEQVRWGGNDNPDGILVVGDVYEVDKREVHSWHTKISLKGIDGWFNSVCFEDAS